MKFTPDGGEVDVRGRARGGNVTIAIEDNGIGIPKDALHKLGRPFEQVESQLTKRHQGSGLGLAIAKSLAELHGGTMRIRSVLGAGTAVVVRLPLEAETAPADADVFRRRSLRRSPVALTGPSQNPHEAVAHLALGFDDIRLKRREIRQIGGACEKPSTPAFAIFGLKAPGRQSRKICVRS